MPDLRIPAAARHRLGVLCFLAVACSYDGTLPPDLSPLSDLTEREPLDSLGQLPPEVPTPLPGPATIHGNVLGPSAPGAGNDSLQTAPRVVGAIVTVYPVIGQGEALPELGPAYATGITGPTGGFFFHVLPAGPVVVTVEPPGNSPYQGIWIHTVIHAGSIDHPWWVVLPKR